MSQQNKATLYEIEDTIREAIDRGYDMAFVDENGEFKQEDFDEWLDRLKKEETQKLENIACYIKNLIAEVNAIKTEEKALADRRKAKENKANRLAAYLDGFLRMKGKDEFETPKCRVSYRKSTALEITDKALLDQWLTLHDEFLKYSEPMLDKAGVKKYMKNADVPGVELVNRKNIQIK